MSLSFMSLPGVYSTWKMAGVGGLLVLSYVKTPSTYLEGVQALRASSFREQITVTLLVREDSPAEAKEPHWLS